MRTLSSRALGVVLAAGVAIAPSLPAGAVQRLIVGVCDVEMTATLSAGEVDLSMPRRTCDLTNKSTVIEVTFGATDLSDGDLTFGCLGGAVEGSTGNFIVYEDGVQAVTFSGSVTTVLSAAGRVTVEIHKAGEPPDASLIAVARLEQSPGVTGCSPAPTTLTWTGPLTFFDPEI